MKTIELIIYQIKHNNIAYADSQIVHKIHNILAEYPLLRAIYNRDDIVESFNTDTLNLVIISSKNGLVHTEYLEDD